MRRPVAAAFAAGCIAMAGTRRVCLRRDVARYDGAARGLENTGAKPVVQLDAQKHPTRIALIIPVALIDALPKKRSEAVYPLAGAGMVQTANLQWHPSGHEPEHVYDVPHFDVTLLHDHRSRARRIVRTRLPAR